MLKPVDRLLENSESEARASGARKLSSLSTSERSGRSLDKRES